MNIENLVEKVPVVTDIVDLVNDPDSAKARKVIIKLIPILLPMYLGNKFAQAWRLTPSNGDIANKVMSFLDKALDFVNHPIPSIDPSDVLISIVCSAAFYIIDEKTLRNTEKAKNTVTQLGANPKILSLIWTRMILKIMYCSRRRNV